MKVVCIDAACKAKEHEEIFPDLREGSVYTAFQCPFFKDNFQLKELPLGKDGDAVSFRKHRFIPCSNISETELLNDRELIKAFRYAKH